MKVSIRVARWFRCAALLAAALPIFLPSRVFASCAGDCDANGTVSIDEVVRSVGVAIGDVSMDVCPNADLNKDQSVGIGELISAVRDALNGCTIVQPFASVQQVFSQSCAFSSCHSALSRQGELVLSDEELSWDNLVMRTPYNAEAADMGLWRVLPGDPERSYLIRKLRGEGPGDAMPQGFPPLPEATIHMIEDWIRRGAPTTKDECIAPSTGTGGGSHQTDNDATNCTGHAPPPVGDYVWKPQEPLPPPPPGEGLQFYTPPRNVDPGKEWETCYAFQVDPSTIRSPNIERQEYRMHAGSHHLLLYMYFGPHPEGFTYGQYWDCFAGACLDPKDCPGDGGLTQLPIGGTQVAGTRYEVTYPPGVGIPLIGNTPVIIANLHYQNPFLPQQEIYGESWVNLYFYDQGELQVVLDGIFAINSRDLFVEPYETKTISRVWHPRGIVNRDTVDAAVFQLFGHMHKRGTEFTIDFVDAAGDETRIYRTTEWNNAPVTDYPPPYLLVNSDEGLRWTCTHENGRLIPKSHDDGTVELVEDPQFPAKKCYRECKNSCGFDEATQTCHFTRAGQDRVYQLGEPMPLVFGELADDDMCNMFGYFIKQQDGCRLGLIPQSVCGG